MTEKQKIAALFVLVTFCLGFLFFSLGRYKWYRSYISVQYRPGKTVTSNINDETSLADKKININSADVYTLTLLPGIGRETALKIIHYRTENGAFTSVNDLINVKGIGVKKLEKIKKYVSIE
jgi:competence protein ComEA